jgi:glycosyltransferase involved in cell wall biosynthesis
VAALKILHTEWSEGWGGQEMRILEEARGLSRLGHHPTVLAQPGSPLEARVREAGIPLFSLRMRFFADPLALTRMFLWIRRERFQVVHTHSSVDSWIASLAAKMAKVPVLARTRHISSPVPRHPLNRVWHFPDLILTTGEDIRRKLIGENRMAPEKIFSVPTGVSLHEFSPRPRNEKVAAELGVSANDPVITLVAVLRTQKRHEVLLDALKIIREKYPRAKALVVGEGPGRARIEKAVRERDLESGVILTGYRRDIPEILSLTNVAVLTSEAEGLPQVLLQYLAMAKPVVATRVGAVGQVVVSGETGILVEPNDPRALARAILELLADPKKAQAMAQAGRNLVETQYNMENMVVETLKLYRLVLAQKGIQG